MNATERHWERILVSDAEDDAWREQAERAERLTEHAPTFDPPRQRVRVEPAPPTSAASPHPARRPAPYPAGGPPPPSS